MKNQHWNQKKETNFLHDFRFTKFKHKKLSIHGYFVTRKAF